MPKRVVIKDESEEEEEKEPVIEPVEEEKAEEALPAPEPSISEEGRAVEEDMVDAEAAYEVVINKIDEIKVREQVTQQRFLEHEEMGLPILKKLLQKWDALREELLKSIQEAISRYNSLKALLEERFSSIEEELYLNQIELDTLHQLEEQGKPISISKKEELEKLIPELRERLADLDKKIKEIDKKVEELRKMSDNVYEITAYKDLSEKLLSQMIEAYYDRLGEDTEPKLRSQIDVVAQREGIPREYAVIYIWKRLKKAE